MLIDNIVYLSELNKSSALAELHDKLELIDCIDAIISRESIGGVAIGKGFAVIDIVSRCNMIVHLGISKQGINFDAIDFKDVHLIFLVLRPIGSEASQLNLQQKIVRISNEVAIDRILNSKSKGDILDILKL